MVEIDNIMVMVFLSWHGVWCGIKILSDMLWSSMWTCVSVMLRQVTGNGHSIGMFRQDVTLDFFYLIISFQRQFFSDLTYFINNG